MEEEEERVSAKKGKKKAAFFIDFTAPPIDTKVAFATTRAATTLSQAVLKKAKEEVCTRTLTTAHVRKVPRRRVLILMAWCRTTCCPETSSTTTEPCAPTFSTRLALLAPRWSPLVPPHPTPFKCCSLSLTLAARREQRSTSRWSGPVQQHRSQPTARCPGYGDARGREYGCGHGYGHGHGHRRE